MDAQFLNKKFQRMGARLKVVDRPRQRRRASSALLTLDIGADRRGEFFEIMPQAGADPEIEVLDVQPSDRHLLLLVREDDHATITLQGWHQVVMNTENESRAMRNVAFLD